MNRPKARSSQALIASLMCENEYAPVYNGNMMGGITSMVGDLMNRPLGNSENEITVIGVDSDENRDGYTPEELRITKRYIELMGSAERARELVDKVDECEDCLDIIDDQPDDITKLASTMPHSPDFPTTYGAGSAKSLYNRSAINGVM